MLKPPQNPVKINSFKVAAEALSFTFRISLLLIIHIVNANTAQANTFEAKVASGSDVVIFKEPIPIMYLSTQPIPPPINTNKKFI